MDPGESDWPRSPAHPVMQLVVWEHVSCFPSLLHLSLDGRPRHLEEIHDLHSGDPFVNCAKHLLSQILWIGSHTSILSPGSIFLQALVDKLLICETCY